MRHINGRHKITDDEHQSWGLSWKPFIKNHRKRNYNAYIIFFENKFIVWEFLYFLVDEKLKSNLFIVATYRNIDC